ncbi:hypothetical protein CLOM_g2406 [Closterium sp. NIES-68]|nr:hypothetical protein CLOM_g2406 [Closterium sp. NIES-68]GJP77940.1 hypothetical protein CLOP_g8264 [Closterium sp. NIES-67]
MSSYPSSPSLPGFDLSATAYSFRPPLTNVCTALISNLSPSSIWTCSASRQSSVVVVDLWPSDAIYLSNEPACSSYLLIPAENVWDVIVRTAMYTLALVYLFIGLATITGKYMEAMENIVQQTRKVRIWDPAARRWVESQQRIWNPAIADITLLALGTCAPQISLAVIDAVRRLGKSGGQDLGAGTIIGGAAFNLFPILAVCVLVPPPGAVKRISDVGVFLVEFVWSLWAYVWLYVVLQVWTPGEVTITEAVMTVLQLPLLMLHAYAQEQRWPFIALPLTPSTSPPPFEVAVGGATVGAASSAIQEDFRSVTVQRASFTAGDVGGDVGAGGRAATSGAQIESPPGGTGGAAMNGHAALGEFSTPSSSSSRRRRSSEYERSSRRSSGGEGGMGRGSRRHSLSSQAEDREWGYVEEGEEDGRGGQSAVQGRQQKAVDAVPLQGCIVDERSHSNSHERSDGSDGSDSAVHERDGSSGRRKESFAMRWRQQIVLSMMLYPSDYLSRTAHASTHPSHMRPAAHKARPVAARVWRVVLHAVCFLWKALCALLIPPPDALHGYPAFTASILVITAIAALVVELASLFGCVTAVNSFVVAITLLASGTSIPDLIASVVAADHMPTADSAIANINASNCIIVFSGMGVPWLITTLYNKFVLGSSYSVSTTGLGFSIIVFFLTTFVCMAILFARRKLLGGELGGPKPLAWLSCFAFMLLWLIYMLLSSLNAYGIIGDVV